MKRFADFQAFSQAGRDLAHWHLNYETVPCYEGVTIEGDAGFLACNAKQGGKAAKSATVQAGKPASHYRVEKMKFAKTRDPETNKSINDKTTVIYNAHLTIRDIPEEAYAYIVNGKPALEWVMERQSVTTDKDSGIVNDANLWATETMNNPKYPLELFLRVITVSLETMKIVNGLPPLDLKTGAEPAENRTRDPRQGADEPWWPMNEDATLVGNCALRFDGAKYDQELAHPSMGTYVAIGSLYEDHFEHTFDLYEDDSKNWAVFFWLQRSIKWCDYLDLRASLVYVRLFLHLHDKPVPRGYDQPEWLSIVKYGEREHRAAHELAERLRLPLEHAIASFVPDPSINCGDAS